MPLIGVSYQSFEKDKEYRERFSDVRKIEEIIRASLNLGVERFAAASPESSPLASSHLEVLRSVIDEGQEIELLPCIGIPLRIGGRNVDAFRRWATYLSFEVINHPEALRRILDDPILNFREGWKEKLPSTKPYGDKEFRRLSVDWKRFGDGLETFVDFPVKYVEPGSETDFLTMTERTDLLGELSDRIFDRGFKGVVFGVHHAGVTIPKLDQELNRPSGYVTPLNPLGLMMYPTVKTAEQAVRNTKKKIFAIKPLAGGRVEPEVAFRYLSKLEFDGCMVGAASITELSEDFKAFSKIFYR